MVFETCTHAPSGTQRTMFKCLWFSSLSPPLFFFFYSDTPSFYPPVSIYWRVPLISSPPVFSLLVSRTISTFITPLLLTSLPQFNSTLQPFFDCSKHSSIHPFMESKNHSDLNGITRNYIPPATISTSLHQEESTRENLNGNIETGFHAPVWSLSSDSLFFSCESECSPSLFPVYPLTTGQQRVDEQTPNSLMGGFCDGISLDMHSGEVDRENSSRNLTEVHLPQQWDSLVKRSARSKRKVTRHDSASSQKLSFSNTFTAFNHDEKNNLCNFTTADGKKLKFILQKELRKSDVSDLGRIVLPKSASEAFLPYLTVKEGMEISVTEVDSAKTWYMRYRFWPNNRSRMYLLENTGEYIEHNQLKQGDVIMIFHDECERLYISYRKGQNLPSVPAEEDTRQVESLDVSADKILKETGSSSSLILDGNTSNEKRTDSSGKGTSSRIQPLMEIDEPLYKLDGMMLPAVKWDFSDLEDLTKFEDYDFSMFDDPVKENDYH